MRPEDVVAGSRVLVTGIYLTDHPNTAARIVSDLAASRDFTVVQRWMALGSSGVPGDLRGATVGHTKDVQPKFVLLNRLLRDESLDDYAFIVICDDDIFLPPAFLDRYLGLVRTHDLSLAQPARTHDSYIDHPFVGQLNGLTARWTRFVEIGPLFSVRNDAAHIIMPFDEASPMGWGYDLVWPVLLEAAGLRLGIVDDTPVAHTLRKPLSHYRYATTSDARKRYLAQRPHLLPSHAFFINDAYA